MYGCVYTCSVRLLRQRSSIDEVLFSLKSQLSVLDVHDDDDAELQEDYSTCSLERVSTLDMIFV